MLRSHHFLPIYRSGAHDLLREFYTPALRDSVKYLRCSGYFSIDALLELSAGLVPFVQQGGIIKMVTSVELSERSCSVIHRGLELSDAYVQEDLERCIDACLSEEASDYLDLIVNLIAAGRLEIRIAYSPTGLYHEKFGLFFDRDGDSVYFNGSANETASGLRSNRESILVTCSWEGGEDVISEEEAYFSRIWDDKDDGLSVMEFPEACRRRLVDAYAVSSSVDEAVARIKGRLNEPQEKRLYPYQSEAVEQFVANGYAHFLQMATGTGKTFTAIKAVERYLADRGAAIVVVIVPQTDLQDQWRAAFEEEGLRAELCGGAAAQDAEAAVDNALMDHFMFGESPILLCVNRTYFSKMAERLRQAANEANVCVVVDEAHTLTPRQRALLPDADARLGLSATPERFEEGEAERIVSYFTRSAIEPYRYDIDQAIAAGFLTPYRYHPLYLEMGEKDFQRYGSLTRELAALCSQDPPDEDKIQRVRLNRSRILKTAPEKLRMLEGMVTGGRYDFVNSVVYCGAGKDRDSDAPIIREATALLNRAGLSAKSFFHGSEDRPGILREFEAGFFDTLVAIKCFDQGVDVKKLDKLYIMASDSSRRQTIQRRGRVLRTSRATGKDSADIYDMVLVPPADADDQAAGRSLVSQEVARMAEYASSAINKDEVAEAIEDLCEEYGVEEVSFDEDLA